MSSRFPTVADQSVITMHGNPESVLAIMWERGYRTTFAVAPDIGSNTIMVKVPIDRREVRLCYAADASRLVKESDLRTPEWWREWHRANETNPPRNWDEEGWRSTRIYFDASTMKDVCGAGAIKFRVVRPIPEAKFAIFEVWSDRHTYRGAQLEWLRRMMINNPTPL